MKKFIWLFANLLLISQLGIAQDIRIYHGSGGGTSTYRPWEGIGHFGLSDSTHEVIKPQHTTIEVTVMNANPFHYTYEIKLENQETTDETPDLSALLSALNAIPALSTPNGVSPMTPANKFNSKAAFDPFAQPITREPNAPPNRPSYLEKFQTTLSELKTELQAAQAAIIASDAPENLNDVFHQTNSGFRQAKTTIEKLSSAAGHFNSNNLEKELGDMLNESINTAGGLTEGDQKDEFRIEAYKLMNAKIVESIKKIKGLAKSDGVIRFKVEVTDKSQKIRLIIKKKESNSNLVRDEINQAICTLRPEFKRPMLEIVPVVNLAYAGDVPEFGVTNNSITQNNKDNFTFKAGAMLLFNVLNFGKYKDGAWGVGLGYNIPKSDILESFYLGTLFSYKNIFRLGGGVGYSEFASGLKDGAKVGSPLPADIANINDIVTYEKRPAFFITFSISGITVLSKK